jgi:hypothetical protein
LDHTKPLRPQIENTCRPFGDDIANYNDTNPYCVAMADFIRAQGKLCAIVDSRGSLKQELLKDKRATHKWEFVFTRSKHQTDDVIGCYLLV